VPTILSPTAMCHLDAVPRCCLPTQPRPVPDMQKVVKQPKQDWALYDAVRVLCRDNRGQQVAGPLAWTGLVIPEAVWLRGRCGLPEPGWSRLVGQTGKANRTPESCLVLAVASADEPTQ